MIKIFVCIGIIIEIVVAFSVYCCLRVGAQADKDIEKLELELERPDLITLSERKNTH